VVSNDHSAPFDATAEDYDSRFTDTDIGRVLRGAVWRVFGNTFEPGGRILELGCGTGEDAVWLARNGHQVLATDASSVMLDQAREKTVAADVADRVDFDRIDLATVSDRPAPPQAPFDGVASNFGALNCLPDCSGLAATLHGWLSPGARVVVVVMGPVCLWEWVWYALHLRPRTALRRLRRGRPTPVGPDASIRVWYPSPGRLRNQLRPWFELRESLAIGALVPPPYAGAVTRNRPGLLRRLARFDDRHGHRLSWMSDHYLLVLDRIDDAAL